MTGITVKADVRQARLFVKAAGTQAVPRATARAINRTLVTTRQAATKLLRKKRAMPAREIKRAISLQRANVRRLYGSLTVSGRSISIRHFARQGARAVTVRIEQGAPRRRLISNGRKAFINPKWRPGVFVRTGRPMQRPPANNPAREGIRRWPNVPGLPTVFVQAAIRRALEHTARQAFRSRIDHELQYELDRQAKRFTKR